MKSIINLVFLYICKDIKNVKIETKLKEAEIDIIDRINSLKHTKEFINEFIDLYDKEELYKIMVKIQREINTRVRKELNNETD
jgi:N-methylhydantoinase B/oxoprolinase/acetone carboxylase alpha subunit